MKHLIILLIFVSATFICQAQNQNVNRLQTDSLGHRVDSIQHELDYLRLAFEIYTLNTDLKITANDIDNKIKEMKMSLYHNSLDRDMYRQYKELYNVYRDNLEKIKELISSKKLFFVMKVLTTDFSETEQEVLDQSYDMTDGLYHQAELSLDIMKSVLDLYYKYM